MNDRAAVTRIRVYGGDSPMDLQWKVLSLAQLQLRYLLDSIESGCTLTVEIGVERKDCRVKV